MNDALQKQLAALLEIAACPANRTRLSLAPDDVVASVNEAIATRSLRDHSGTLLDEPVQALLAREDRQLAYPVRNDIPVLLKHAAIALSDEERGLWRD